MSSSTVARSPPGPPEEALKSALFNHVYKDIDAPLEKVWRVLTDLSKYKEWNTFVFRITVLDASTQNPVFPQKLVAGRTIRNEFYLPPSSKTPGSSLEHITIASHEEHRLEWYSDIKVPFFGWNLLHTNRTQWLSVLEGGGTRYESCLTYDGMLSIFARWLTWKNVQDAFQATADGLKMQSEK